MLSKEGSLSIILPVYNEEASIKNVISNVIFYIRKYIDNFEVVVVNDGCTDKTLRILSEIKTLYPELRIASHERNKGYGSAVRTGIGLSQNERVFIMDSDGQFRIDDFEIFWKSRESYDFILGYRSARKDNVYRRWLAKSGNYLANLFLKKRIRDVNCGFKMFRLRELRNIPLISTGGCIYFEILYYLLNFRNRFLQLPVTHYRRKRGKQTGGNLKIILRNIWEGRKIVCHK